MAFSVFAYTDTHVPVVVQLVLISLRACVVRVLRISCLVAKGLLAWREMGWLFLDAFGGSPMILKLVLGACLVNSL